MISHCIPNDLRCLNRSSAHLSNSMGGLLIADSVLRMQAHKQQPSEPLWPRVIAVIAFDTPVSTRRRTRVADGWLTTGHHTVSRATSPCFRECPSLHHRINRYDADNKRRLQKNGITKYTSHIETARTVLSTVFGTTVDSNNSSSTSSRAATPPKADAPASSFFALPTRQSLLKGSAVVLGGAAAAGAAYWRKDDIQFGWNWVSDHAVFVRNLWDDIGMRTRLEGLAGMVKQGQRDGIVYRK